MAKVHKLAHKLQNTLCEGQATDTANQGKAEEIRENTGGRRTETIGKSLCQLSFFPFLCSSPAIETQSIRQRQTMKSAAVYVRARRENGKSVVAGVVRSWPERSIRRYSRYARRW